MINARFKYPIRKLSRKMLIVVILLLLTGCAGDSSKGDYIEFFGEIWWVDMGGNVKLIYDDESAYGMYANDERIYFFDWQQTIVSYTEAITHNAVKYIDIKTNEVFTLCESSEIVDNLQAGYGFVEYGDYLYCLSEHRVGITGNYYIARINKNDGSVRVLDVTHSPTHSTMFVVNDDVIYSCGWDMDTDSSYVYEYDILDHSLVAHDIDGILRSSRESEDSYRWAPCFDGEYVYIIESKGDSDASAKIYRSKLGGELKFTEYVELPDGFSSRGYISENRIVYFRDYEDSLWQVLLDENMQEHKIYETNVIAFHHISVIYYDNIFVCYASSGDDILYVADYDGNAIEVPFENLGR